MLPLTPRTLQNGLPFVPARWYRKNRTKPVRLLVIHTAECGKTTKAAEHIMSYNQRRDTKVSCHEAVDADSVIAGVRPWDTAWTQGVVNDYAYSWELAGRAGQSKADWADDYNVKMLALLARRVAMVAVCYDIPIKKLTPAAVKRGDAGICGHWDITRGFEVRGGHWDPGPSFPWKTFIADVKKQAESIRAGL